MLKLNSQSYDVAKVQNALNQIGAGPRRTMLPYLVPDGIFGVKTHARVVEFQRMNGLKPDGVVGPETLAAIGELLPAVAPAFRPVGGVTASIDVAGYKTAGDVNLKIAPIDGLGYKPRKPELKIAPIDGMGYKPRKPEGNIASIDVSAYKPRKP
jgi:peptidoglycan hydrolase-like protein with peptidoglycan-binding domain